MVAAAAFFASLPSTPSVQAQFPANGQITGNLTVTGTPGMNVVNLSNFLLNNGSGSLTLTGPAACRSRRLMNEKEVIGGGSDRAHASNERPAIEYRNVDHFRPTR
jgi:hypothetical protein